MYRKNGNAAPEQCGVRLVDSRQGWAEVRQQPVKEMKSPSGFGSFGWNESKV